MLLPGSGTCTTRPSVSERETHAGLGFRPALTLNPAGGCPPHSGVAALRIHMKEHAQRPARQHERIMQDSNGVVLMCPLTMSLPNKLLHCSKKRVTLSVDPSQLLCRSTC